MRKAYSGFLLLSYLITEQVRTTGMCMFFIISAQTKTSLLCFALYRKQRSHKYAQGASMVCDDCRTLRGSIVWNLRARGEFIILILRFLEFFDHLFEIVVGGACTGFPGSTFRLIHLSQQVAHRLSGQTTTDIIHNAGDDFCA